MDTKWKSICKPNFPGYMGTPINLNFNEYLVAPNYKKRNDIKHIRLYNMSRNNWIDWIEYDTKIMT